MENKTYVLEKRSRPELANGAARQMAVDCHREERYWQEVIDTCRYVLFPRSALSCTLDDLNQSEERDMESPNNLLPDMDKFMGVTLVGTRVEIKYKSTAIAPSHRRSGWYELQCNREQAYMLYLHLHQAFVDHGGQAHPAIGRTEVSTPKS